MLMKRPKEYGKSDRISSPI